MEREPANEAGPERVRVLVIGSTPEEVAALAQGLADADGSRFELEHAPHAAAALARLAAVAPAAVLIDLSLPQAEYEEVKRRVQTAWPAVPILVLATPEQEARAWRAVHDGAQDYLVRGRWNAELLRRTFRHAIERQRLVAELRHRLHELQSSEARFRSLIEKIADGVVIVDNEGVIRFVNPAADALFTRSASELLGELFGFPIVVGETTEIDIVRPGGSTVTAELRVVETSWEGEEACVISLRDITDRKRAEEKERELIREQAARAAAEAAEQRSRQLATENARLYEQAQEANRAKSDFLAVMSHELRTPLNAILGYVDLLEAELSGPLTEKQRHDLERIRLSSQHLLQLVEEILTYARVEAARLKTSYEPTDPLALLQEVAVIAEPLARDRGIAFRLETGPLPGIWQTDPAKVRQILLNLLSNAVKFTEAGTVGLRARQEGETLAFQVHDTGIGIAAESHERIFEPFWQVEQAQTRTVGGTGLGLSVARRLARLLGGDITVESTPGQGSTFTVRLPLDPSSPATEALSRTG